MNKIYLVYGKYYGCTDGFWKSYSASDTNNLLIAFHNSEPHFNIEHATNYRRMAKIAKKFI